MNMTVILIVVEVPEGDNKLKTRGKTETIQTPVKLKYAWILRRFEESSEMWFS